MSHRRRRNTSFRGSLGRAIQEGTNAFARVSLFNAEQKQRDLEEQRRQESFETNQVRIQQENEAREFRLEDLRDQRKLSILSGDPVDKALAQRQIDLESPGVDRRKSDIFKSLIRQNVPGLAEGPIPERLMKSSTLQSLLEKRLFVDDEEDDLSDIMGKLFLEGKLTEEQSIRYLISQGRSLGDALPALGIASGKKDSRTLPERYVAGDLEGEELDRFGILKSSQAARDREFGFETAGRDPVFLTGPQAFSAASRTLQDRADNLQPLEGEKFGDPSYVARQQALLTTESIFSLADSLASRPLGTIDNLEADSSKSFGLEQPGGGGSPSDTPLTPDPDPVEIQGVRPSETETARDLLIYLKNHPDELVNWDAVLASDSTLRLKVIQSLVQRGLKNAQ